MYLFFDTETTGLPGNWRAPLTDVDNWPRLVQIAWILFDEETGEAKECCHIVKPENFEIPPQAAAIHGIDNERALLEGKPISEVLSEFIGDLQQADYLVAHNISFDLNIVAVEFIRLGLDVSAILRKPAICTKVESTDFCGLPRNKWPTLQELYQKIFNEPLADSHDALADVRACFKSFMELKNLGVISLDSLKSPV